MNELLTKFKSLCVKEVELPDSGTISTTRLNVEFQNKLFDIITDLKEESNVSIHYLLYLNNYIIKIAKKDTITYIDKLYLIEHWRNELLEEQTKTNFKNITIADKIVKSELNDTELIFKLTLPTLIQENNILNYILSKEKVTTADILFFDIFRFLQSIKLGKEEYILTDMTLEQLYELYLLLDIKILNNLTTAINTGLGDTTKLRAAEADFSFFVDL